MYSKKLSKATDILSLDATSIARLIKEGNLTSVEATRTYIEHIKKVNPKINALVEDRFTEAMAEAEERDMLLKQSHKIGPLHGVPISVKEAFQVENMKTTGGLEHRQDLISRTDADVIAKLKEAGAVILGKTNTPALCFCQETDNKLYGRTNNPWDVTKTAGGSSGGEGALLAAGGAAVGIGSDIGGSIRIPSHFNGVVGFKPGMHQVSANGHFPSVIIPLQERMLTMGPMGKSVRDMELVYDVIAERSPSWRSLQRFKIEILPRNNNYPLGEATKVILNHIEKFISQSYSTKQAIPPLFEDSALLWQEIMSMYGSKIVEDEAFNNDRSNVFSAFFKEKLTQRTKVHPYLSWAIIGSKLFKPSKARIREIEGLLVEADKKIEDYLRNRILIFPVYHSAAPNHGEVFKEIFSIRKTFLDFMPYVAYANVWGLPSLTIPVTTDENGMPIGVQLISSNGNENALFQLGRLVEKRFRGYVRFE